jgi:malate dehydrogenase (oxaloacetate-decarboxylating)(NADP+)
MTNLVDIIEYVKPTALMGLSTISVSLVPSLITPTKKSLIHFLQKGAFTPEVLQMMASINARPIIFPLSNPVRLSECSFNDAVEYTNGRVLFASGSPFPEQEFQGSTLYPGQGNNMYIFPGTPRFSC